MMFGIRSDTEFLFVRAPDAVQLAQASDALEANGYAAFSKLSSNLLRPINATSSLMCGFDLDD